MESPQFENMPIKKNLKGISTDFTDVLHAHLDSQQLSTGMNGISTDFTDAISGGKDRISINFECVYNLYEQNDQELTSNRDSNGFIF